MSKYFDVCPICGAGRFKSVYGGKWSSENFFKCAGCGLILKNPQEDKSETLDRYGDEYYNYEKVNEVNFFNLVKKTMDDYKVFSLIPPGSNVLEIGCATGLFLKYMNENGYKSTGVEVCSGSAEYGRKNYGVNIINSTLEDSGLENGDFSLVHFSHLIEHLNDPVGFLKKVHTLTASGGYVIVTTPNSSGIFSGIFDEEWRCIVSDHLFLFNKSNLIRLLRSSGFDVVTNITWGGIPAGKAPLLIKRFMDRIVKLCGIGDVVSILARKR